MIASDSYFSSLPEYQRSQDLVAPNTAFEPFWQPRHRHEREPDANAPNPAVEQQLALDQAYARGWQEASLAKTAEFEEQLAQAQTDYEVAVAAAEASFMEAHANRLASAMANGLSEMKAEIDAVLSDLVRMLVADRMKTELVDELLRDLTTSIDVTSTSVIRIKGPEKFADLVAENLSQKGLSVHVETTPAADVAIAVDGMLIRSRVGEWIAKLDLALR